MIYLPIINFIFIFQNENKHSIHIRNGIILSIIILIIIILNAFLILNYKWLLLILFPICFGIWKLDDIAYRMPYIYELYRLYKYIWFILKKSKKEINKRKKEVVEVNLKVE